MSVTPCRQLLLLSCHFLTHPVLNTFVVTISNGTRSRPNSAAIVMTSVKRKNILAQFCWEDEKNSPCIHSCTVLPPLVHTAGYSALCWLLRSEPLLGWVQFVLSLHCCGTHAKHNSPQWMSGRQVRAVDNQNRMKGRPACCCACCPLLRAYRKRTGYSEWPT